MNPVFLPAAAFACIFSMWLRRFVRREGITDKVWFWVGLFSGAAMLGALLIIPKYNRREATLELKYLGRQRAVPSKSPEINGTGGPPTPAELSEAPSPTPIDRAPNGASELIVPPYYLAGIIGIVFLVSSVLLQRDLSRVAKKANQGALP